jgi:hypothetical protein
LHNIPKQKTCTKQLETILKCQNINQLQNIPNGGELYRNFSFQGLSKCAKDVIFGLKIYHPATLLIISGPGHCLAVLVSPPCGLRSVPLPKCQDKKKLISRKKGGGNLQIDTRKNSGEKRSSGENSPKKQNVTKRGIKSRVARWHVLKPKIPIWINFGGPWNGKCWYILWPYGIHYSNLVYFMASW